MVWHRETPGHWLWSQIDPHRSALWWETKHTPRLSLCIRLSDHSTPIFPTVLRKDYLESEQVLQSLSDRFPFIFFHACASVLFSICWCILIFEKKFTRCASVTTRSGHVRYPIKNAAVRFPDDVPSKSFLLPAAHNDHELIWLERQTPGVVGHSPKKKELHCQLQSSSKNEARQLQR